MRPAILAALGLLLAVTSASALPPNNTDLQPLAVSANTGEKPQSKVWTYAGRWWCVLPNAGGTWVWRLDGDTWTSVLKLSDATNTHADAKAVGAVTHILLYAGVNSELASVEYVPATQTYQAWSGRAGNAAITLDTGVETATIDVDSQGRMWLASDEEDEIRVRWSDSPYSNWSGPHSLVTGVNIDDISVVAALPDGHVGVLWSNQATERWGFRLHTDGADPTVWGVDEVPASLSAINVGNGMADDHMNVAVASDATLYVAAKTSYDTAGYPKIAALVRRPAGTWDALYGVSETGTRGIMLLNEAASTLTLVYTSTEGSGDILFRESPLSTISFGAAQTLISGGLNEVSSTKQNITGEVAILATEVSNSNAVGVLRSSGDGTAPVVDLSAPDGGESWPVGSAHDIQWTSTDNVGVTSVALDYSVNGGGTWRSIASGLAANGSYSWTVPNAATDHARVRARAFDAAANVGQDVSAADLAITGSAGPIGWWRMEEGAGSTSLLDASGRAHDAALPNGATWVPGTRGLGLSLNGTNQRGVVADAADLDLTCGVTLATWVRPTRVGTQHLMKKATNAGIDGYELSLGAPGKAFARFNERTHGNLYRIDATAPYAIDGTWTHLAVTYDGAAIKLYVNGVLDSSKLAVIDLATNTLPLSLGAQSDGQYYLQGTLDESRVYDRALSASEIAALASHNIAASAGPGGSISPAGDVTVSHRASQAFDIAPNAGCSVADVQVDGASIGAVTSHTFNDVQTDHAIAATFTSTTADRIAAEPPPGVAISTGTPCLAVPVVFTRGDATPVKGYSITLELSANLSLCGVEFASAGYPAAPRDFAVTPLGGNRWTVAEATAGGTCGATGSATLFTVHVTSAAASGTGTLTVVSADVRDCADAAVPGAPGPAASVPIDRVGPAVATDLAAAQVKGGNTTPPATAPGLTRIQLSFTAPGDAATIEVYRKPFGGYPQYDEAGGATPVVPAYPPDETWKLTGVTASGQADEPPARDVWYYVLFSKDVHGNVSSVSNRTGGTLDYHLGDVSGGGPCAGDDEVDTGDISLLGSHYGDVLAVGAPFECLDVGPTLGGSVDARPLTDNLIEFEDLVVFALNYKRVSAPQLVARAPAAVTALDALALEGPTAVRAGETFVARLTLRSGGRLQALSAGLGWERAIAEPIAVVSGGLFEGAGGVTFRSGPAALDGALLGRSTPALVAEGPFAIVTFRALADGDPALRIASARARDRDNREIALDGTAGGPGAAAPSRTRLAPARPMPFTTATTLEFALAAPGRVTLGVFGPDGRRVRTLAQGVREAGVHRVTWSGDDDHGRTLSPGVYFVRLEAGGVTQSRTVVRLGR